MVMTTPGQRAVAATVSKLALVVIVSILAAPLAAEAQLPGRVWRIAYLMVADSSADLAFYDAMQHLGYIEGRNLVMDRRNLLGKRPEALEQIAQEVVRLNVDLIVAWAAPWATAAKRATSTIPIVFVGVRAPIERGIVPSLARPGGNVTGISSYPVETLDPKLLELAKELMPQLSHVAVLRSAVDPPGTVERQEHAARVLGLKMTPIPFSNDQDASNAAAAIERSKVQFLIAPDTPLSFARRKDIVQFAARTRLPVIYAYRQTVRDGGLMALFNDFSVSARRAALYVDKIFKGTSPADLPVEQSTQVGLAINLKTAKALRLAIPQSLLLRADQIID